MGGGKEGGWGRAGMGGEGVAVRKDGDRDWGVREGAGREDEALVGGGEQ